MKARREARTPEQIERDREYHRAYRAAHPELNKKYYWRNPEAKRKLSRDWQKANTDRSTARKKQWREANIEMDRARLRRQHLKRYGLTENSLAILLSLQGGKCAICRQSKKLCVDHCHNTGRVRGMLCNRCNSALGVIESFKAGGILARALKYLKGKP